MFNYKYFLSEMSTILQYTMLLASVIFCVYIPLVPISVLYAKMDQYQFIIQIMMEEEFAVLKIWGFHSAVQICRGIFVFLNCYQISRTISLSFLIGFPYLDRLSRVTSSLTKLTPNAFPMDNKDYRLNIVSLIRSLQQIQVIARTTRFLNEGCTAGAMATVAAICILLNVTILTGYGKIIFSFYIYIVSANCLAYIGSYFTLLPVIKIFENCCEIKKGLLLNINSSRMNGHQQRYCKLKVKSLQPWSLSVGFGKFQFFYITNSTKILFYNNILSNTINLLLSISLS